MGVDADEDDEGETYVLYRRVSDQYTPDESHIQHDRENDEWLAPSEGRLDHLEGAGLIEVLQWEYEHNDEIFLSGPVEPIIDENNNVALMEPRSNGQGVDVHKIGQWRCKRCETVQGQQIKRGETPEHPPMCESCEREGPFEAVGLERTEMNVETVADPMWSPPGGVSDARYDELWSEVRSYIERYWYTEDEEMYDGLTAYAIATWLRPNYGFLAHLAVIGKFETGKSRLLNTLSNVSYRGIVPVDASPASVFRTIDTYETTFFLSEFHDLVEETRDEINALIKGAQKRNEIVLRAEARGDSFVPRAFNVFTHVGVGTQYGLPDDTASRCIEVNTHPAPDQMPDLEDTPKLRNELLYARYRLLGSIEWQQAWEQADEYLRSQDVKGRLREKLLSLVTVADLWGKREEMDAFIDRVAEHQKEVAMSSEDAMVVQSMMEVAFEKLNELTVESLTDDMIEDPWAEIELPYSDITEKYEQITGNEMSNRKFGHLRKRLDLGKKKRARGTVVAQDDLKETLKRLADESGLEWKALESDAVKEGATGRVRATTDGSALYREIEPEADDDEQTQRDRITKIIETVREYSGPGVPCMEDTLIGECTDAGFDESSVEHTVEKLRENGTIIEEEEGCYKLNE